MECNQIKTNKPIKLAEEIISFQRELNKNYTRFVIVAENIGYYITKNTLMLLLFNTFYGHDSQINKLWKFHYKFYRIINRQTNNHHFYKENIKI